MLDANSVFDPTMVEELQAVVKNAWISLTPQRRETTKIEEIARMVMVLAAAGVLDEDTIIHSISQTLAIDIIKTDERFS